MRQSVLRFETGEATHVGNVRAVNEDDYFVDAARGVWLVADGMGGHENGKLASATVVKAAATIGHAASAADLLARFSDRMARANDELLRLAERAGGIVGSTVAALLAFGPHYACVWSGDSRVYLIRSDAIMQLSRDHTEVQEMIDRHVLDPVEARHWPARNVLTKALGVFPELQMDVVHGELKPDDRFVLCSDGLTSHVDDAEILECMARRPQRACEALLDRTLIRGAQDNLTVVVLDCMASDDVAVERVGW